MVPAMSKVIIKVTVIRLAEIKAIVIRVMGIRVTEMKIEIMNRRIRLNQR